MDAIARAFDDYQQFTKQTAQFPAVHTIQYLGLGLGDEAGELLEKADVLSMKTTLRAGRAGIERSSVLDEAGDVMWYLAQLLLARGHSMGAVWLQAQELHATFEASVLGTAIEVAIASSAIQGRLKKELRDGTVDEAKIVHHAARVMRALSALARALGTDLPRVAEVNRAKLLDRLQRNVIKGEGDAR